MKVRLEHAAAQVPLSAMPPAPRRAMRKALRLLADDALGRSTGLNIKVLHAPAGGPVYRLRVGEWRAGFLIRGGRIDVVRILHRSEGYGWLDRLHP